MIEHCLWQNPSVHHSNFLCFHFNYILTLLRSLDHAYLNDYDSEIKKTFDFFSLVNLDYIGSGVFKCGVQFPNHTIVLSFYPAWLSYLRMVCIHATVSVDDWSWQLCSLLLWVDMNQLPWLVCFACGWNLCQWSQVHVDCHHKCNLLVMLLNWSISADKQITFSKQDEWNLFYLRRKLVLFEEEIGRLWGRVFVLVLHCIKKDNLFFKHGTSVV